MSKPEQTTFVDIDNVPAAVKRAATIFKNASEDKSKANTKFKSKYDNLIAVMEDNDCDAVPVEVNGVLKVIYIDAQKKLKQRAYKEAPEAGE